jgi:hypothetical protein
MSGIETALGVYTLITGTITIVDVSIQIYNAVKDTSGITKELSTVSRKLPSIKELLEDAAAQYNAQKLGEQEWLNAGADIKSCNEACQELQEVLESAYPQPDASKLDRVFKNLGNIVSRKGKTAEQLLKDIYSYLELLKQRRIITNARLLEDIKEAVDELFPKSGVTQNNVHGDNIGRDKKTYTSSGSGHMFTGDNGTYNIRGT